MNFNEKFLSFFQAKGLTHGQIARKLGVSRPTINRILNENHPPSFKILQNFAEAYPDANMNYLVRDDYGDYTTDDYQLSVAEDSMSGDLLHEIRIMEHILERMKLRLSQY